METEHLKAEARRADQERVRKSCERVKQIQHQVRHIVEILVITCISLSIQSFLNHDNTTRKDLALEKGEEGTNTMKQSSSGGKKQKRERKRLRRSWLLLGK